MGNTCVDSENQIENQEIQQQLQPQQKIHFFDVRKRKLVKFKPKNEGTVIDYVLNNIPQRQYNIILMELIKQQQYFEDEQFPPCKQVINIKKEFIRDIKWLRPQQIFQGTIQLFGSFDINSVKEGLLDNYYFYTLLTILSLYPELLRRIFMSQQYSQFGLYCIWLCIDGLWKQILIDDKIPCLENVPAFAYSTNNQLWVVLLEKAFAKAFGSYGHIQGGIIGPTISAITNAPYQYLNKLNKKLEPQKTWNYIIDSLKKSIISLLDYILCASSQFNQKLIGVNGIVSSHSFVIVDAQEVVGNDGRNYLILMLKNPWNEKQWNGKWSDYSKIWTMKAKEIVKFSQKVQGQFWMSIQDFVQQYGQVCRCMIHPQYYYFTEQLEMEITETKSFKAINMQINNLTHLFLTITQKDHRYFKEKQEYIYSLVRIIVIRINQEKKIIQSIINQILDYAKDTTMEFNLEEGLYFVGIQIDWMCDITRKMVFGLYSSNVIQAYYDKTLISMDQILEQIVNLHQQTSDQQQTFYYIPDRSIKRTNGSFAGYIYYSYVNESNNLILFENVELKQQKNLVIYSEPEKFHSQGAFQVKLMPHTSKNVILRVSGMGKGYYSYKSAIQHWLIEDIKQQKILFKLQNEPINVKRRQINQRDLDVQVLFYNWVGGNCFVIRCCYFIQKLIF